MQLCLQTNVIIVAGISTGTNARSLHRSVTGTIAAHTVVVGIIVLQIVGKEKNVNQVGAVMGIDLSHLKRTARESINAQNLCLAVNMLIKIFFYRSFVVGI